MARPNIEILEIKARCDNPQVVRRLLNEQGAEFKGVDRQVDTYFRCKSGRLKLREGNIENNLIHYHRPNQAGPKNSSVRLYRSAPDSSLRELLAEALGVLVVVRKSREIYFIGNVKFHIDQVDGLGNFVEIEAIDSTGAIGPEKLQQQCEHYVQLLSIQPQDLIECSYSDMLIEAGQ